MDKKDYTLSETKSKNLNKIIRAIPILTEEETSKIVSFMEKENMIIKRP